MKLQNNLLHFFNAMQKIVRRRLAFSFLLLGIIFSLSPGIAESTPVVTQKELATAIQNSTSYLLSSTMQSGQFVYTINLDPRFGMIDGYDIVRHGGAMYGLGLAYQAHPDPGILAALQRSSDWLFKNQIKPLPGHEKMLGIWETPTKEHAELISTGDLGLGLVGLMSLENAKPGTVPIENLHQIAETLLWMQKPDGSFQTQYYPDTKTFEPTFKVLYYPGEAALGLAMLYEKDYNQRWLLAAANALAFLAKSRRGSKDIPPDHWAMIATQQVLAHFDELSHPPITRDELLDHARAVCLSLMQNQQPASSGEVAGSFSPQGFTTPAATRMEGLLAALQFLPAADPLRQQIHPCVDAGIAFLVRAQIKDGTYIGAIPNCITRKPEDGSAENLTFNVYAGQVRIDYVQHALDAFLQYQKVVGTQLPMGN